MKKRELKKTIIITALTIFTILLMSLVSADSYSICLKKGEKIRFSKCNPYMKDYSCEDDRCQICVNETTKGVYCPSNSCGALGGTCSSLGNATIDSSAPIMNITSPLDKGIYNSKSILTEIHLNEKSTLSFLDNIYGKNKSTKLCTGCYDYSRRNSFKEGFNNLTFKAVDSLGHESYETRTFTIDSKIPRVHKTEPRSDYADGKFEVQYSEENIKRITLFYGNLETGFRNKELTNCLPGEKQWCSVIVDLKDYDEQKIEYYFEVEDIASSVKKSQIRQNLRVDTTFPVLNNPSSFWNYTSGSRYVYFNFSVTEKNLDKIIYSYLDSRNKTREVTLCSRLDKNNICETKKSFTKGNHSIDIQITDRAGNAIGAHIIFSVDY